MIAFIVWARSDDLIDSGYNGIIEHFNVKRNDRILDRFQDKYECCGDVSPRYWNELPDSCCTSGRCDVLSTILIGCALKMELFVKASTSVVIWASAGVSVVGMFGVFLSWRISDHLNSDSVEEEEEEDEMDIKPTKKESVI